MQELNTLTQHNNLKSSTSVNKVAGINMAVTQHNGTGRHKTSVARVYIQKGKGNIAINGRSIEEYFGRKTSRMIVRQPLELLNIEAHFDIKVNVMGGGV